ncbi:putative CHY-type Zn-finger protein [Bacillus tianshenii]|uniref:CHY-type Zn-finger protein n=1 Tax=Sutcliffiella tianshenii TaxID=1463404 RepID=A0ABS2P6P9_9BACI|nr:CHY zinc finger protein [Bacillus tianshenii]MBM7622085.1 putative CHY-type Zn-finger protein [Bacillus tianshenii]
MHDRKEATVYGQTVDNETRCVHYQSRKDIIAIKFYCCQTYFPCYQCHDEHSDHPAQVWPKQNFGDKAILCGVCQNELTIHEYLGCNSTCPKCSSPFNPGCQLHYHLYFEIEK